MYVGTSEPCVGLLHLAAAFPRITALIGCIAVGTIAFPIASQRDANICASQDGQVITHQIEGSICIIDPVAPLLMSDL